jgi:secondary thiamine-phosphate synthase enzyme
MHTIKVRSHQREELVEFTEQVQQQLTESGEKEGIVVLYVQHTTAGLTVNENADPDVPRDMLHALRTLIPQHGMGFRHGEENSDAHIKASVVGSSVTIPFTEGKLLLGRWQGIFLWFRWPRGGSLDDDSLSSRFINHPETFLLMLSSNSSAEINQGPLSFDSENVQGKDLGVINAEVMKSVAKVG